MPNLTIEKRQNAPIKEIPKEADTRCTTQVIGPATRCSLCKGRRNRDLNPKQSVLGSKNDQSSCVYKLIANTTPYLVGRFIS